MSAGDAGQEKISTVTVNGLTICQAVVGTSNDGASILLLHGWGSNIDLMLPLARPLASLGYRIFVPDLPGFGESPPPPQAWSVFDYAAFVVDYLRQQELERVHLFGHSFGGRLSIILGAEHAERLGKIVLADSAGVRSMPSAASRLRTSAYRAVRDGLKTMGLQKVSERLQSWYTDRYGSADYKAATGVMRETFVKVVNEDLLPYAARMKPSTLLLWGDQDQDTPLWQGQKLEQTIPDAGLVVFKGAGHYSYLDQLTDTVSIIDFFFRQSPTQQEPKNQ
jgi:pimeloyl-ACP methyl ester carboxylesterase